MAELKFVLYSIALSYKEKKIKKIVSRVNFITSGIFPWHVFEFVLCLIGVHCRLELIFKRRIFDQFLMKELF